MLFITQKIAEAVMFPGLKGYEGSMVQNRPVELGMFPNSRLLTRTMRTGKQDSAPQTSLVIHTNESDLVLGPQQGAACWGF